MSNYYCTGDPPIDTEKYHAGNETVYSEITLLTISCWSPQNVAVGVPKMLLLESPKWST